MEYLRDLVMKVIKCATRSVKPMACFLPQYRNDLLIGYILNYFVPADIDSEYTYFLLYKYTFLDPKIALSCVLHYRL